MVALWRLSNTAASSPSTTLNHRSIFVTICVRAEMGDGLFNDVFGCSSAIRGNSGNVGVITTLAWGRPFRIRATLG